MLKTFFIKGKGSHCHRRVRGIGASKTQKLASAGATVVGIARSSENEGRISW
jgi:NAD(P)-dependent dehydrogenase (short-subunit alcohol dehydrogenase family)